MDIKIVTFNINHGGNPTSEVVRFIQEEDPDIVFLQEVYAGKNLLLQQNFRALDVFKTSLNYDYFAFFPRYSIVKSNTVIPNGNLTLSRFPILKSKGSYFTHSYREFNFEGWFKKKSYSFVPSVMLYTQIKVNSKKNIHTFNVHGPWGVDGKDSQERTKMVKMIKQEVNHLGVRNIILAGDFNMNPDTYAISSLDKKLVNVFKDRVKTTFNIKQKKTKGNWSKSVVDMIFLSRNLAFYNPHMPLVNASDHFPLVCHVEI